MTTTLSPQDDATLRQRQAADPGASVWVSASAGTGKTKVLTDRVLSLLLAGTAPQKILCLTFTRAAAAEMASRISDRLGEWTMATDDDLIELVGELLGRTPDQETLARARRLFAEVLDTPGGMHIETIHAFCQSLLRRFPLEADIAPHFSLITERDTREMIAAAEGEVLAAARSNGREDSSALAVALSEVTRHVYEAEFSELVTRLTNSRGRLRRLIAALGGVNGAAAATYRLLGVELAETVDDVLAAAVADDAIEQLGLQMAAEALLDGSDPELERGKLLNDWLASDPPTRMSQFDEYVDVFLTKGHRSGEIKPRARLINKKTAESAPGAAEVLAAEAERLCQVLAHRRAVATATATAALLVLSDRLLAAYQDHKEGRAQLDYDDLILEAAQLLHRPGIAPWVLFKLDGGLDHVLIDEAQDTSPDQWAVVDAIADEFFAGTTARDDTRTVFAVGDVKQSIYSFQGAAPEAFNAVRAQFAERVPGAGGRWENVALNISFRSTKAVLQAVDAVFAQDRARDGVSLDHEPITHAANRELDGGLVELWPAVLPNPADETGAWKPPIERIRGDSPQTRLARLVATRIAEMIDGGEILEAQGRPIHAGDIMVLVRRRSAFVDDLVRELKEREIAVAGVDRLILTEHIAVMDLMALGHFLLLPEDDLTLATVLKGPLIGLTEDQLFELAYGREGTLWAALGERARTNEDFAAARDALAELLGSVDQTAPFELFSDVLGRCGGRRRFVARLGRECEDPISEFLNLALEYDRSHVPSLQGFLHWLAAGAVEVKRDLEHGTPGAVRVMTVHGAKGLQAPIVFLPDTLQKPRQSESLLWHQAEDGRDDGLVWPPRRAFRESVADTLTEAAARAQDQEYRRLLYVAMTRAEDRLYVCGWQTRNAPPEDCWYSLIADALSEVADPVEETMPAEFAGQDDAQILRLTCPQIGPVASELVTIDEVFDTLPSWITSLPDDDPLPPQPLSPSRPGEDEPASISPLGTDDGSRFRRGLLIHALLQTLPDIAVADRAVAAATYMRGAAPELSEQDQTAIVDETLAVLSSPEARDIFGEQSRAEVPIVGMIGDQVISGQIDRLVVGPDSVMIVDYKTNRPPPAEVERVPEMYRRQMAIYRAAVARIYPEREIVCALLWTDGPHLMVLPETLTAEYVP